MELTAIVLGAQHKQWSRENKPVSHNWKKGCGWLDLNQLVGNWAVKLHNNNNNNNNKSYIAQNPENKHCSMRFTGAVKRAEKLETLRENEGFEGPFKLVEGV